MSRKLKFGFELAEKILGILIAAIGAALAYYTYTSLSAAGMAAVFFIGSGFILVVLGLLLLVVKTG